MREKQDIIWEKSTMWESIERWVSKYLKTNHSEYRKIQSEAIQLVEENPAVWKLMNDSDGVTLSKGDHETLHRYFETESAMQTFELEYYFLAGQIMTFSYGNMLARLKKDLFGTDAETSNHLIEILTNIRSDELEEQLQSECKEYRDRVEEEKRCETEVQKLNLSKRERKIVDSYVTAANNRWLLCGDYLYQSGMKDILLLLENR